VLNTLLKKHNLTPNEIEMKRSFTILTAFLLGVTTINAQNLEWAKSFGGTAIEDSKSIAVDGFGNVYTTGFFNGTVDFDPGSGTTNLTSNGGEEIFVQKMDAAGNFLWAKSFGGSSNERAYSLTVDGSGNVYTTGYFSSTVDFDPGPGITNLTSSGNFDVFVHKMDASGNLIWIKSFGSIDEDQASCITVDGSGNIYTTGAFSGTVDFDPGPGITNLTSSGNLDVFVHKMDASGNLLWARTFGNSLVQKGFSIAVDESGNVYTAGNFAGTIDLNPGAGTTNLTSNGGYDIFIQKMDATGSFLWGKSFGGSSDESCANMKLDGFGHLYNTGFFYGTVDFNLGSGISNQTSNGNSDIFVQKIDVAGNFHWAKTFGGTGYDAGESLTVDTYGNVYTTGYFYNSADFNPGPGTSNLTSNGSSDIFVQKMNAIGNLVWAKSFGGTMNDYGQSITVDGTENVYLTGLLVETADFDPGAGVSNLTSNGLFDVFVQKLSQCQTTTAIDTHTACNSFIWIDGITYTASNNVATYVLTNASGCDSIVTLNLIINQPANGIDVQTSCGSYTWIDGNTYTASNNTATFTIPNGAANNCDSIVTLNLTINQPVTGTDVQTACGSFTWIDGNTYTASNNTATFTIPNGAANNCDSIVTLNLTINQPSTGTDVQTACESYVWIDGNTYTASNNTATFTIPNGAANNCDSIVTLNLTINQPSTGTDVQTACESYVWIDGNTYTASNNTATFTIPNGAANNCDSILTLNLTIIGLNAQATNNGNTTIACTNSGVSYQWINCGNGSTITGATAQTFTATANGSYAVVISDGTCSDTSNCITIANVGIAELKTMTLKLYPNPSNDLLTIELTAPIAAQIEVLDMNGRRILLSEMNSGKKIELDLSGLQRGSYMIKISDSGNIFMEKLILQ
jgi:hypothetical protein